MRRLLLYVFLLLLILPLNVSAQDGDGVIIRYPIFPDPEHLDPFRQSTIAIGVVNNNIYEGFIRVDQTTGEILPGLAESWEISEDNLTYTFHLRQGVLYHEVDGVTYDDGDREFKADDWVWAAELSHTEDEAISAHPEWMNGVVGAEEFLAGTAEHISGIEMVDDYTIRITLTVPNRLFLLNGAGAVPAVPHEAYQQLEDFGNHPVGTGPFKFVEWQRDDHITVTANEEYWEAGHPIVDGVTFINVPDENTALLLYRSGDLDLLFSFPAGQRASVIEEFNDQYHELAGLNVRYFGFKMDQGFFAENPLVRQAFAHAFNRELVWNELMEGARFPATQGYLPPAIPTADVTAYPYDLERAAELLTEAGFPNGEGIPTIQLYVFSAAGDELSLPVLQADLLTLGVTLEIVVEDASTYWTHIGQDDVIMFLSGWSAGIIDPADVFDYLFYDGLDDTAYNNPEVNALLDQARQEFDPAAREVIYRQAHELIIADSPWIVSAYSKVSWLQQPWISGFEPGGGGTHTARLRDVSIVR
jgi:ABC-type transport system substrate-binding protein